MTVTATALTARCTVVVAAAGYGKTTRVRRWVGPSGALWRTDADPTTLAGDPAFADGSAPRWVVVDGVPGLGAGELRALAAQLPSTARLVLTSRWPVSLATAKRHRAGLLAERGPADLALDRDETAEVLRRDYGLRDPDLAAHVHRLTAGWPALVHGSGERLAGAPYTLDDLPAVLAGPGTPIAAFLTAEVLTPLPPAAQRLVRDLAHLGPVDGDLCAELGHRRWEPQLGLLAGIGLLVPAEGLRLVPLVAHVARDRWPVPDADRRRLLATAGAWYAAHGQPGEAIRALLAAGEHAQGADLLRGYGPSWVVAGGAPTIAAAIPALPAVYRCDALRLLLGEALLVIGEDDRAVAELTALAGTGTSLAPGVAWRLGAVHYLRAETRLADEVLARGRLSDVDTADEAMLLAWRACVRWMSGDSDSCAEFAHRALDAADRAGDDRARACAHVVLAMQAMLSADRPETAAHYAAALRCAENAGDLVQAGRIRANQASLLIEEAHFAEALISARLAVNLTEATGYAPILAVALCNEAEALGRLGQLDAAADSLHRALRIFQRRRSRKVAYPLVGLGAIHRLRGRAELARAAYAEAVRVVAPGGDQQGTVRALAGLARVTEDRDEARELAARARDVAKGPYRTEALLVSGWIALGAGEREQALAFAADAAGEAGRNRDRAGLADALELRAAASGDPAESRRALREAAEMWRMSGASLDVDRVVVAVSALPDATMTERIDARLARERLERAGIAVPTLSTVDGDVPAVTIRALGRFQVLLDGVPLSASAWQSRKARDLLRILVARRGRATARDELADLLWPEDDPEKLGHRLSVALSTLRAVLDPGRQAPPDQFVLAGRSGIALDVTHVELDLESFLGEAAHGLRLRDQGYLDEARTVLAAAERRYGGDLLEDEPYDDWAVPAREEARATYLRVARALAELSSTVDGRVQYLLRVLDKDPYDEQGHRDLVDALAVAGRHGEARRAYERYVAAMRTLGVAPPPPVGQAAY